MSDPKKKLNRLKDELASVRSAVIAFSGGVDSSFLLKVAHDTFINCGGKALAVTANSPTYPEKELKEALELAKLIGVEHMVIESKELGINEFTQNPPNRCYYCKTELYGKLGALAQERGFAVVLDGANADDMSDYRPGMKAARELDVRSLLQEVGLTKDEIRLLSKEMGLPTWNKPAMACLSSRFPYWTTITPEKLNMVEVAEVALRNIGFDQVRVRHHGNVARIELAPDDIARAVKPDIAEKIHSELLNAGFAYVALDIIGYRTGSMNEALIGEKVGTK